MNDPYALWLPAGIAIAVAIAWGVPAATAPVDRNRAAEILAESDSTFLRFSREVAYSHHEKWDGSGYPLGLAGEAIPLSGRLMAIADVYDALISKRVYKAAMTHDDAVKVIGEGSGGHFDPALVEAFLSVARRFDDIALAWSDAEGQ